MVNFTRNYNKTLTGTAGGKHPRVEDSQVHVRVATRQTTAGAVRVDRDCLLRSLWLEAARKRRLTGPPRARFANGPERAQPPHKYRRRSAGPKQYRLRDGRLRILFRLLFGFYRRVLGRCRHSLSISSISISIRSGGGRWRRRMEGIGPDVCRRLLSTDRRRQPTRWRLR